MARQPASGEVPTRYMVSALTCILGLATLLLVAEEYSLSSSRRDKNDRDLRLHAARSVSAALANLSKALPALPDDTETSSVLELPFQPSPPTNGAADWVTAEGEVPEDERFHQSLLHATCLVETDAVVPWTLGAPGYQNRSAGRASNWEVLIRQDDPNLLEKLRQCPDVDIFLPGPLRGHGYCEDGVAYTKYLESRLLPMWVFQIKLFDPQLNRDVDYFDLCPKTPVIFFNHYWDGLTDLPRWPTDKPVWLMPNIEMFELKETHYWRADAVLCKTQTCFDRVSKWLDQEGNPRDTKVFYTKFTSSDQANFARMVLGAAAIRPKDFEHIKFLHTAGSSSWKGTNQIIDCWLSKPDLPPIELFGDSGVFKRAMNGHQPGGSQLIFLTDKVDALWFSRMMAEAAFVLCPSEMEGYGHYLNQARAAGAVVITTDIVPLNELISSDDMGFRIPVTVAAFKEQFLGGESTAEHALKGVEGMRARFDGASVCTVIEKLVKDTTPEQRAQMGERARGAYHADTKFFARSMRELRASVRATARAHEAPNATETIVTGAETAAKNAAPSNNLRQDSGA